MLDDKITGTALKAAIDEAIEIRHDNEPRDHLGASIIGRECSREIWYSWRWANNDPPSARLARLFDRGHKEEHRFEEWLSHVCKEFHALDPETGKQFRVEDFAGYFGGSLDGIMVDPGPFEGKFLSEFKTHSDKSFQKVSSVGVQQAKPEHYVQMQIYLHYYADLRGAFYFAINKNDDSLYIEYVERDEKTAIDNIDKARSILSSPYPPERKHGASPYNFYCKNFCSFRDVCFNNVAPMVSCRSCDFCKTAKDGFTCNKTGKVLSHDDQREACDLYERRF